MVGPLWSALLGAKLSLEQMNSIIKKPPREIPESAISVAARLNHSTFIAEAEAKHLVGRTTYGEARRHEFLHLLLGE